jgi:predicted lactoylglutathione lyase
MTSMRHTVSFVSLLVADVVRSRSFYEAMGLEASARSRPEATFFQMNGLVLAVADRSAMSTGLGVAIRGSRSSSSNTTRAASVVLSHNVRREDEVDELLARAKAAGGRIEKPAGTALWGGRTGCFADPDGHLWEVVFNDGMPMDAMGNVFLEPPGVW